MKTEQLNEHRLRLLERFPHLEDMGISEENTVSQIEPSIIQIAEVAKYFNENLPNAITALIRDLSAKRLSTIDYNILKNIHDVVYCNDEHTPCNFMLTINSVGDTKATATFEPFNITEHKNTNSFSTILLNRVSFRDYVAAMLFIMTLEYND